MRRGLIALAMGWYLLVPRVEYDLVVDPTIATWTQNSFETAGSGVNAAPRGAVERNT